eukprot:scaffold2691_cov417-Prasinococcus_capsulatus_cf.AAC.13
MAWWCFRICCASVENGSWLAIGSAVNTVFREGSTGRAANLNTVVTCCRSLCHYLIRSTLRRLCTHEGMSGDSPDWRARSTPRSDLGVLRAPQCSSMDPGSAPGKVKRGTPATVE